MQKIKVLKEVFGFDTFRSGQEEIIDAMNDGKNVLAVMPTGGGKSLCYQLPALLRSGTLLIISPLIALMRDQVKSLVEVGVTAAALHSQNTDEEITFLLEKANLGELKMLYVSPERLASRRFINLIKRLKISLVAVDEAHCVSQWGFDFRPDYLKIGSLRQAIGNVQIAAFTATADYETRVDIIESLFMTRPEIFVNGFDRPNIKFNCKFKHQPRAQLLTFVRDYKDQSGIVYCGSRAKTEVLARALQDHGYKSEFYHAGMTSEKRKEVEDRFQREDGLIVCATIAFGMGIDKPDIRFVIHADLPKSIENFYQEIGRAGRDGLPAESLLLYNLEDARFRRMQIDESSGDLEKKTADHIRLNALLGFAESQSCRRSKILEYFEKEYYPNCQNCDLCSTAPKLFDGTEAVRKILSVILRTKENFGANHLIDIIRGVRSNKVRHLSHDQLPTFGLGRDLNKQQWQSIFLQILGLDLIRPSSKRRGAYYLTKKSLPILKGLQNISLKKIDFSEYSISNENNRPKALVLEQDEPLFVALRKKRRELADSLNVPSYIIFSDKTLIEMVDKKPNNLDDMHAISGVGQKKLLKFGDSFLSVITGKGIEKIHPIRKKIAGKPNVWLYDLIEEVIKMHDRGENGLEKPLYVSPSLILKIFEREPKKLSDLQDVSGMTDKILKRYGRPLIRAISSSGRRRSFKLN